MSNKSMDIWGWDNINSKSPVETDETYKEYMELYTLSPKEIEERQRELKKEMNMRPYGFKFFYKDGTVDSDSQRFNKPEELYIDFDGLLEWDDYYALYDKKLTTKEILEMAMELYDFLEKEYYRIEIVNWHTNEIVDYIDQRE